MSNLGRRRRKGRPGAGCTSRIVRFKTRHGVVSFRGKKGPGCGPRRKPSTRHLAPYKRALAHAARSCKGLPRHQFQSCVASELHR